jgi:hypothetical protein
MVNNQQEEQRQLISEARPLVDNLMSNANQVTCAKLKKILDKFMELSINMPTGREHDER